jgi:hypothetical protein
MAGAARPEAESSSHGVQERVTSVSIPSVSKDAPKPIMARLIETTIPARRCCAPGCGDKIQDTETYEITWSDGGIMYLESGCVDWFVNGHPDYGCARGPVDGLPSTGRA